MPRSQKIVAGCLGCMIVSLLLVGVASGTLLQHTIQVLPILGAVVAVARRPTWGPWAAIPILLFWLLIMVLIWLYLLGIARIITGTFTSAEIVLTVVIGASAAAGLLQSARVPTALRPEGRAALVVTFAALEIGAMWYSYAGPFAGR